MTIRSLDGYEGPAVSALSKAQPASLTLVPVSNDVPPAVNKAELQAAVKKLNEMVSPLATSVEFTLDEESGKTVVKVIDMETRNVLRQIPNEEALAFSRNLDRLQGLILRQQV